jgi:hypothetical protein
LNVMGVFSYHLDRGFKVSSADANLDEICPVVLCREDLLFD